MHRLYSVVPTPHLKRERDREALQTSPSPPPHWCADCVGGGGLPAGVGDWSLQGQYDCKFTKTPSFSGVCSYFSIEISPLTTSIF
jgi:hypothetical protein